MFAEKRRKIACSLAMAVSIIGLQPDPLLAVKPSLPKALEEQRQQIEQEQQAVQTMQTDLQGLEAQITTLNQEQQQLEAEIMTAMENSQELQEQVNVLEQRVAEQTDRLRQRLRLLYARGEVSLLEVLLDSEDFSDFIDRYRMLVLLVEQDNQLIDRLEQDRQQVEQVRAELAIEQEKRQAKQRDLMLIEEQVQQKVSGLTAQITAKKQQISTLKQLFQKRLEVNEAEKLAIRAFYDYQKRPTFQKFIKGNGKNGTYAWPVPSSFTISSPYGMRDQEFHNGIDIAAPIDTPIVAASDGVVLYAGPAAGFGHWVVLAHENGMLSVYGHMYKDGVLVQPGQEVKQGEVIAKVGNDGHSSGPHLHFALGTEVTAEGLLHHVNPLVWLQ